MLTGSEITETQFQSLKGRIARSGAVSAQIKSDSMAPLIKTGAEIEIEHISDFSRLRAFDILVIWNGKILLCHYLCHRNQFIKDRGCEVFVTRGLGNRHEDVPVTSERILGKVGIQMPLRLRVREFLKQWRA